MARTERLHRIGIACPIPTKVVALINPSSDKGGKRTIPLEMRWENADWVLKRGAMPAEYSWSTLLGQCSFAALILQVRVDSWLLGLTLGRNKVPLKKESLQRPKPHCFITTLEIRIGLFRFIRLY